MHELSTGLEGQSKIDELGDSHSHKRPNLTVFQSLLNQAAIALLGFNTDKNSEYTVVPFAWMHKCNQMISNAYTLHWVQHPSKDPEDGRGQRHVAEDPGSSCSTLWGSFGLLPDAGRMQSPPWSSTRCLSFMASFDVVILCLKICHLWKGFEFGFRRSLGQSINPSMRGLTNVG